MKRRAAHCSPPADTGRKLDRPVRGRIRLGAGIDVRSMVRGSRAELHSRRTPTHPPGYRVASPLQLGIVWDRVGSCGIRQWQISEHHHHPASLPPAQLDKTNRRSEGGGEGVKKVCNEKIRGTDHHELRRRNLGVTVRDKSHGVEPPVCLSMTTRTSGSR